MLNVSVNLNSPRGVEFESPDKSELFQSKGNAESKKTASSKEENVNDQKPSTSISLHQFRNQAYF